MLFAIHELLYATYVFVERFNLSNVLDFNNTWP